MNDLYVFGYGSLMNKQSLHKTLPGKTMTCWTTLKGYKRIFNKPGKSGHRYLNIKEEPNSSIKGVLIKVTESEFEELEKREHGYIATDVTAQIDVELPRDAVVYAFIAPPFSGFTISRAYLDTVLAALPEEDRKQWIQETDFDGAEIDEEN